MMFDYICVIYNVVKDIQLCQILEIRFVCCLSGLELFNIYDDLLFVNVGECINVIGLKKFFCLICEEKFVEVLEVVQ